MSAFPPEPTPIEARVLAVLIEKQHTVPDSYPMTLNSLLSGCNQKTSRDPVMTVREAEALEAIDTLKSRVLVIETTGSRAMRYEHNARAALGLVSDKLALLTTLMLRGPQTAGELRLNAERLHRFADISSIEACLEAMAEDSRGAWVVRLARQPGAREARWAHRLCGDPVEAAEPAPAGPGPRAVAGTRAAADDEVQALRAELARLRRDFDALAAHLGWSAPPD